MTDSVVVRAPGTVANLGPGFDALGLALAWYDEIRVERGADHLDITASGAGADQIYRDERNGIVRGIAAAVGEVPPVRIHRMTAVAFGRGFGSSAIAFVAGLVAARALFETNHTDDDLLALATELEGHPDNVAPCLLGGITVCAGGRVARVAPPVGVEMLVCVAPSTQSTDEARAVLPDPVARADAVGNVGRAALLVAALATGATDLLLEATADTLHQPSRFELLPASGALVRALRGAGIAAFLSGAGPSVAAFVNDPAAQDVARSLVPAGWDVRLEAIDGAGTTVVASR